MKRNKVLLLCGFLLVLSISRHVARANAPNTESYVFLTTWGNDIGQQGNKWAVSVHKDRIYVFEDMSSSIVVYDINGRPLFQFGGLGAGPGQFYDSYGLVVDELGFVYATSMSGIPRIQKFSPNGQFLSEWVMSDYGEDVSDPRGIAVDGTEWVYVADSKNHRILKLTTDGSLIKSWGTPGDGPGEFNEPWGIAIDRHGTVYVADYLNHRIQKFSSTGQYLMEWGQKGSGPEQFNMPIGLAVDEQGYVYVADRNNERIQKFTSEGKFVTEWGDGGGSSSFDFVPIGVAVDDRNRVYVVVDSSGILKQFSADGSYLTEWGSDGNKPWLVASPNDITIDDAGFIYISEQWPTSQIKKFTPEGNYVAAWPASYLAHLTTHNGHVYVADENSYRVQKYTSSGQLSLEWGKPGHGPGEMWQPRGTAVDSEGHIFVLDSGNRRIQKFSAQGVYITEWGSHGDNQGQFVFPNDMAIDSNDFLYVTDNYRVQKFNTNGEFVSQWGELGSNMFSTVLGIDIDKNNHIYVADRDNGLIQKFTDRGVKITEWGTYGSALGQFNDVFALAVDSNGRVLTLESGSPRVQVFARSYPSPDPTSGLIQNGSFERQPAYRDWRFGGESPVSFGANGYTGNAVRLGEPTPQAPQNARAGWIQQTIHVGDKWQQPTLTFKYHIATNDTTDFADFRVWLSQPDGIVLTDVLRDGYPSGDQAPPAGTHLGWRTGTFDLSAYKGQTIRVNFEARNIHSNYSLGIWTYLDNVAVVEASDLPSEHHIYLPMALRR